MKIKYKFSLVWLSMAILWVLITTYLGFSYLDKVDITVAAVIMFLPAVIVFYYLFMPAINYVTIINHELRIHKSFIVFKHKIKLEDIHHCSIMRKDFVIFTKKQDVHPLHMDWMKKEDMIALAKYLNARCRIEDKESNSFSIESLEQLL